MTVTGTQRISIVGFDSPVLSGNSVACGPSLAQAGGADEDKARQTKQQVRARDAV